ncbi:hypothetical protein QFZ69_001132 [Arthrobacter sp. V1I7]|nr:hypothetical protein [Arthrobacter sp. V1I7]
MRRCGGQLGGVHDDPGAVLVGQGGQGADRQDLSGDVGGAGDGEQADAAVRELPAQLFEGLRNRGGGHDAAVRHRLPWQQVGVVFDIEVEDLAGVPAVFDRQAAGQQVQRVGGVAGEDHGVVGTSADKLTDDVAGVLVDRRADLRGVAGAAVDAGVVRQDLVQVGRHDGQGGGGGSVVQVGVADVAALDQRRLDLRPGDRGERLAGNGEAVAECRLRRGAETGGGGKSCSSHGTSLEKGSRAPVIRACRVRSGPARSSPGAPHREWRVAGQQTGV